MSVKVTCDGCEKDITYKEHYRINAYRRISEELYFCSRECIATWALPENYEIPKREGDIESVFSICIEEDKE